MSKIKHFLMLFCYCCSWNIGTRSLAAAVTAALHRIVKVKPLNTHYFSVSVPKTTVFVDLPTEEDCLYKDIATSKLYGNSKFRLTESTYIYGTTYDR